MNASTPMTQNSPNTNGVEVNEILGIIDDIDSDLLSVSCARRRASSRSRDSARSTFTTLKAKYPGADNSVRLEGWPGAPRVVFSDPWYQRFRIGGFLR